MKTHIETVCLIFPGISPYCIEGLFSESGEPIAQKKYRAVGIAAADLLPFLESASRDQCLRMATRLGIFRARVSSITTPSSKKSFEYEVVSIGEPN